MWFPMKKGQQNGGILPEKREGYLKAVEFIIRRLMTFPDNQTRKMGGVRTVAATPSLLAQPNEVRFFGEQGLACPKQRSRKLQLIQFLFVPEKPRGVREVWRSQTCARSRLSFAFFSLAKQRKGSVRAGMRRKGE
ncbi:hypothetical protein A7Q01_03165 [Eikenella sp. NML96-A-049]|uniref:hypothetical protein n=1 Tax=Eikenella sp. NML96-A-049 TaxID=1809061 RepID=UPI0007E18BD9|nr:hypothetical protein [Eikenella sp. NML96-A-049]OAM40615.1 hypothetical protein A7Q01_03165 [Eikenella sp. NML96-A-049]